MLKVFLTYLVGMAVVVSVSAQTSPPATPAGGNMQNMQNMPGMPSMTHKTFIDYLRTHETAGTDAEPTSTPESMLMFHKAGWVLMLHGVAFVADIHQSGPRGGDKLFAPNWIMPMAQRNFGRGTLTFRTMLSLEPATVTNRYYPELFQQGETAYGRAIVDGQHPHDLFMELAAMYDYRIGDNGLVSIYAAPVGSPALGPVAFPHRSSAAEDPIATLGHHLEDSTHIADEVFTLGLTYRGVRLEGSGFHGREPDEFRWDIDTGRIDSWATRVTVNFHQNWSFQYSIGQLHSPEALSPHEDLQRMTASLAYNRPLHNGNWASMVMWGRNRNLATGNVGNGYLLESTLRFAARNNVWTRIENVDRTNELLEGSFQPTTSEDRYFARVQAYTAGYDRELGHVPHLSTALGAQFTAYAVPKSLQPVYGTNPVGAVVFLRLRLQ